MSVPTLPNGPAFPIPFAYDPQRNDFVDAVSAFVPTGLTKRELFAAMALQGMLGDSERNGTFDQYAIDAVKHADALLAELAKEVQP